MGEVRPERKQYFDVVDDSGLPTEIVLRYNDGREMVLNGIPGSLRYGLTPGKAAREYLLEGYNGESPITAEVIQEGKKPSFSNKEDLHTGLSVISKLAKAFPKEEFVAIMKHGVPYQVAKAASLEEAHQRAFDVHPYVKSGGTVALSGRMNKRTAELYNSFFVDNIIAQDYTDGALDILTAKRKKNMRIFREKGIRENTPDLGYEIKNTKGGILLAEIHELNTTSVDDIVIRSNAQPSDERELNAALFQWTVNSAVRSNTATLGNEDIVFGIGTTEGSRVEAIENAVRMASRKGPYLNKWRLDPEYSPVLTTDGFPPKVDSIMVCKQNDVNVFMSPIGAIKDNEILDAADALGMVMLSPKSNERPFVHR